MGGDKDVLSDFKGGFGWGAWQILVGLCSVLMGGDEDFHGFSMVFLVR